jgi:4-hydroxy-tetrahydrodipicolinate synthase
MMQPLSGVIAAAVTPHKRGTEPDIGATLELIDFLCAAGVQAIALLGSTGEFVNLNFDDRVRLVYLAVKRSRIPVLAGVSHSTLDGAMALGCEASAAGAAGLLLMPPFFFRYRQPEIHEFYLRFADGMRRGRDASRCACVSLQYSGVHQRDFERHSGAFACERSVCGHQRLERRLG